MDITAKKIELIALLIQLQDLPVINKIDELLKGANSLSENKKSEEVIENLLSQSENEYVKGEVTEHETFEKESMLWD